MLRSNADIFGTDQNHSSTYFVIMAKSNRDYISRLPPELRDTIYDFAFFDQAPLCFHIDFPGAWSRAQNESGRPSYSESGFTILQTEADKRGNAKAMRLYRALAATSSQVGLESSPFYYSHATLKLVSPVNPVDPERALQAEHWEPSAPTAGVGCFKILPSIRHIIVEHLPYGVLPLAEWPEGPHSGWKTKTHNQRGGRYQNRNRDRDVVIKRTTLQWRPQGEVREYRVAAEIDMLDHTPRLRKRFLESFVEGRQRVEKIVDEVGLEGGFTVEVLARVAREVLTWA